MKQIQGRDVCETVSQNRSDTKWRVEEVCNVTYCVDKISPIAIGKGEKLPTYITKNKGLIAVYKDAKWCVFRDNLCFFRCLAYAKMGKNFESEVMALYSKYMQQAVKDFPSVTLEDIATIEKIFEVCLTVCTRGLKLKLLRGPHEDL